MKIKELLSKPESWIKGSYALDKEGNKLYWSRLDQGCKWCLLGAVGYCYPNFIDSGPVERKLKSILGVNDLSRWNDAETTKHKDVLELCIKADV